MTGTLAAVHRIIAPFSGFKTIERYPLPFPPFLLNTPFDSDAINENIFSFLEMQS